MTARIRLIDTQARQRADERYRSERPWSAGSIQ
jgi:hypothetical protein